jgi:hypothetical protein
MKHAQRHKYNTNYCYYYYHHHHHPCYHLYAGYLHLHTLNKQFFLGYIVL